uniref:Putative secreted peptide n=1 Tax=Anopheles braziliensis TaxID=58242 RepID=A0A2M3ZS19_9DIPT
MRWAFVQHIPLQVLSCRLIILSQLLAHLPVSPGKNPTTYQPFPIPAIPLTYMICHCIYVVIRGYTWNDTHC